MLPQTDLEGAYQLAERVRKRLEETEFPILPSATASARAPAGDRVSFGAAALPETADDDKDALVAAADAALYEAKRAGKNRTVRAE